MSAALQYLCRCSVYAHPCRCEECGQRAVKKSDREIEEMMRQNTRNVVQMVREIVEKPVDMVQYANQILRGPR